MGAINLGIPMSETQAVNGVFLGYWSGGCWVVAAVEAK